MWLNGLVMFMASFVGLVTPVDVVTWSGYVYGRRLEKIAGQVVTYNIAFIIFETTSSLSFRGT